MATKFRPTPSIPQIPANTPKELRPFLNALRDASVVRFGQNKNRLDRSITVRELRDLGLIEGDGTNIAISKGLGTIIEDSNGSTVGGPDSVPTPDLVGAQFSVNLNGVVITWSPYSGLQDNAISYTEIWRVGPFEPLADDSYPPMTIGTTTQGENFVDWVNPATALDDLGNPMPQPQVELSGVTPGYIYGESLEQDKSYVYFLRFVGTDGAATAWHSISGTRVDAVVDFQAYLDILEGQIDYATLDSTLQNEIDRITDLSNQFNQFGVDLTNDNNALYGAIDNSAQAQYDLLQAEVAERRDRFADIIDFIKAVDSSWDVKQEGRNQITDATIQVLQTTMNQGDAALAAQIESIVAASGSWFIQAEEPPIDPEWNEAYHWIDTDAQKRHYVSTDASRADDTELFSASTVNTPWLDNGDGSFTIDGTQTGPVTIDGPSNLVVGEDYAVGLKIISQSAGSVRIKIGSAVSEWYNTTGVNAMYNSELTADGTVAQVEADADFVGVVKSIFVRPNALDFWPANPTLSSGWIDNGGGSYTHEGVDANDLPIPFGPLTATGLITDADEYRITFNAYLPTTGSIGVRVAGAEVGVRQTTGGFHAWTFTASAGDDVEIVGWNGYDGTIDSITIRRTSGWQGWVDVTDTRIESTIASVVTETIARKTSDEAFASQMTQVLSRLDNPTTGLAALAAADTGIYTYVNDQGSNGLLATSALFTNLETRVTNAEGNITGNATANQELLAHLEDLGPDGYLVSNLFSTSFENTLYDNLNGQYVEQTAFDEFYANLIDTTEDGFLAEQGWLIDLKQEITNEYEGYAVDQQSYNDFKIQVYDTATGVVAQNSDYQLLRQDYYNKKTDWDDGIAANLTAISDLNTYVRDDGPAGFFAGSQRLTDLETIVLDQATGVQATSTAFQNLETGVRSAGGGILAQSQYLTQMFNSVGDDIQANYDALAQAVATETSARVTQYNTLEAYVDNEVGASIQQNQQAIANLDGEISARYSNKLQVTLANGETRMTGFEFFDNNGNSSGTSSNFIIQTDAFQIRSATNPNIIPFYMNSDTVVMDFDVMQLNGFIPSANIGSIDVGKITGDVGTFVTANIQNGSITSAKISNTIESNNYVYGQSGWKIFKDGTIRAFNLFARGNITARHIEADSVAVNTLNIAGEAVTVTRGASPANDVSLGASYTEVCRVTVDWGGDTDGWPSAVYAVGLINLLGSTGNGDWETCNAYIAHEGGQYGSCGVSKPGDMSTTVTPSAKLPAPEARFSIYKLMARSSLGRHRASDKATLTLWGGKR